MIQTERLLIRPYLPSDEMDVFDIYKNEKVCRYLLYDAWKDSSKFQKKLMNKELSKDSSLSLAIILNDKVIGDVSIWYTDMKETVEIGYVFHPDFHGKGYAYEALKSILDYLFHTYPIHRIQTNMDARNTRSANLCQKLGMRKEAHFIQDYWNKGEWTDSFIFGILEKEMV